MLSRSHSIILIFLATIFWAWSFIAAKALALWPISALLLLRFGSAFLITFPLLLQQKNRKLAILAFAPGILMGLVIAIQTWAVRYESIGVVALLSSLYFIFVPIVEQRTIRVLYKKHVLIPIIFCFIGLFFYYINHTPLKISSTKNFWIWIICIGGSVLSAMQINLVSQAVRRENKPFIIAMWGHFWTFLVILIFQAVISLEKSENLFELIQHAFQINNLYSLLAEGTWSEILFVITLVFLSTVLAFWFQYLGQFHTPPWISSFIYLLEAPLAAVMAYFIFGEPVSIRLIFSFIFLSIAVWISLKKP